MKGFRYPWGNEDANPKLLNYYESKIHTPTPVGVYPLGASPEGALDMAGNVWEWCADWFGPYSAEAQEDPKGPKKGDYRVLRGGSWLNDPKYCRGAYRDRLTPDLRNTSVGFRVASGT
jgi:formylglycine-generating enzyme required for sulfatase activity